MHLTVQRLPQDDSVALGPDGLIISSSTTIPPTRNVDRVSRAGLGTWPADAIHQTNINEETQALMEEGQEQENELRARIYALGKTLFDAGHQPDDEAVFKAWRATWVPLASHIRADDPLPEA